MPRTKVSKANKRNREASHREEKIREYDAILDSHLNALELQGQLMISEVDTELQQLVQRMPAELLGMKFADFLELKLCKFSDWTELSKTQAAASQSLCNSSIMANSLLRSIKAPNPNDEGYLTEDSTNGGGGGSLSGANSVLAAYSNMRTNGRTPGPLSSARARRPRRSRSACGDFVPPGSALKPMHSASHHQNHQHNPDRSSRSKLRTPTAAPRHKAFSADRNATAAHADAFTSPSSAFIRWPKPGELVLSTNGSPLVAQVMPDKFANVNIPVRNGVLSLRPKKLDDLRADIINSIDPERLHEIKTLHASLGLIMQKIGDAAAANK